MSADRINQAREALQAARQFIRNGVEFGYIRMPDADTPDSAHDTLPMIETALSALAAQPAQAAPSQPVAASEVVAEHGQLDPRRAYETAQNMLRYVEAFNGQEWALSTLGGNVDRKNLAVALDNLQECAAMLLNQSDRLRAALSAPQPAAQPQAVEDADKVDAERCCGWPGDGCPCQVAHESRVATCTVSRASLQMVLQFVDRSQLGIDEDIAECERAIDAARTAAAGGKEAENG